MINNISELRRVDGKVYVAIPENLEEIDTKAYINGIYKINPPSDLENFDRQVLIKLARLYVKVNIIDRDILMNPHNSIHIDITRFPILVFDIVKTVTNPHDPEMCCINVTSEGFNRGKSALSMTLGIDNFFNR